VIAFAITLAPTIFRRAAFWVNLCGMDSIGTQRRNFAVMVALWAAVPIVAAYGQAALADPMVRVASNGGTALDGYDPVAYFTEGRAVRGAEGIALRWRGVRWHFANESNRAAFEANPRAYAPQFAGYCTVALSEGRMVQANPEAWVIHEGRLFLAETRSRLSAFTADPPTVLGRAVGNWQKPPADEN
jgi:hypothetical protein